MEVMTQTWKNGELTISTQTPILSRDNVELCRMEVLGIVEQKFSQEEDADRELIGRRIGLAHAYQTLPEYGSLEFWEPNSEDEQAQQALLSVEQSDLPLLIRHLPEKLKSVIWLIYWEGRTEKDAARILGVSDRTVRNRLQGALKSLRVILEPEGKTIDG